MTDYTARLYFTDNSVTGEIIAIRHGETGYHETDLTDIEAARRLNAAQGITPAQAEAARACSMFGNWPAFDTLAAAFHVTGSYRDSPPVSVGATVTENGHGTG